MEPFPVSGDTGTYGSRDCALMFLVILSSKKNKFIAVALNSSLLSNARTDIFLLLRTKYSMAAPKALKRKI